MAEGRFVSYFRVSTARQGASGLGLAAQEKAVADYLNGGNWTVLAAFTEVESGRKANRAELTKALDLCRMTGATLVIAKLDRLARDAYFLLGLRDAGVEFVAADMPFANRLTVGIMALVAEEEAKAISARTKAALARSTKKLGGWRGGPVVDHAKGVAAVVARADVFAAGIVPHIRTMQTQGLSLRKIAARLNEMQFMTARGGAWEATTVRNILNRA